jgi:E3 ubiquitin-protein ligase MUL1
LEMRQDYREKVDGQGLQSLAQFFTGHKVQGYKRKENFIPVGAILTVVGELTRNSLAGTGGGAKFAVRAPPKGDFIITSQPVQQLHAGFTKLSFVYKTIAVAFSGLGAFLIVRKAMRKWLRRRRELHAKRMLVEAQQARDQRRLAAATAAAGGDVEAAAAALAACGDDRESDTCVVCLEAQSTIAYVACGHMCVCQACSKPLKKCPVCRMQSDCIKVFRM